MTRRRTKRPIPADLRRRVFERDNYTCRYCGQLTTRPHCDHVYPESRGGVTDMANLATSCRSCNIKKHAHIGIWPMPVDFQDQLGGLRHQIEAAERQRQDAERQRLETENQRQEMEARHDEAIATVAAAVQQVNLYAPLLLSLAAAALSLGLILLGLEAKSLTVLLTGVVLACLFSVLAVAFRLSASYLDRQHSQAVQSLGAHVRHNHKATEQ